MELPLQICEAKLLCRCFFIADTALHFDQGTCVEVYLPMSPGDAEYDLTLARTYVDVRLLRLCSN